MAASFFWRRLTADSNPRRQPRDETIRTVELALHLPLIQLGEEPLSLQRLAAALDGAGDCRFAAISANDDFIFQTPWLDGLTALASVTKGSGWRTLAPRVSLSVLRGPAALAKTLSPIDVLSQGRVMTTLGPGSSEPKYRLGGTAFKELWRRFVEAGTA